MGRLVDSIRVLDIARNHENRRGAPNALVLYNLADALDKNSERARALSVFQEASRVDPRYAGRFPHLMQ